MVYSSLLMLRSCSNLKAPLIMISKRPCHFESVIACIVPVSIASFQPVRMIYFNFQ